MWQTEINRNRSYNAESVTHKAYTKGIMKLKNCQAQKNERYKSALSTTVYLEMVVSFIARRSSPSYLVRGAK